MKPKLYTDFDGTLSKGYISMDFMDFLFHERLYNNDSYKSQQAVLKKYKEGVISYDKWCEMWGNLWAEGMRGQRTSDIEESAKEFYKKFRKNIYASSYYIMNSLIKDYDVSMISVGAYEVVSLAAENLGIKNIYATVLESDERYTGKILTYLHLSGGKEKFLKKEKGPFIGIGDSKGDIGFLTMAETPLVMNPDKRMREHALSHSWTILDSNEPAEVLVNKIYSRIKKF